MSARVTMGLPVYNGAELIAEAIESLLAQTYTDFELVISDNGSTDDTPTICRRFAERDPRVRYVRHEINRGAAWNYNVLFEGVKSEYFRWVAHDDICAPTYLEKCVKVLDENPDVAWVHSQYARIDESGNRLPGGGPRDIDVPGETITRASALARHRFRAMLTRNVGNAGVFGLMRTDVIRQTALHGRVYGADKVFVAEVSLYGRYHQVPEVLFLARHHVKASGAIRTAAQLRAFADPSLSRWFAFPRLRLLAGYVSAVRRAPLGVADRLGCYMAIMRYLLQVRKWGRVVHTTLKGTGVGGGYAQTVGRVRKGAT